jgi:predicted PurR-regulated permease PerM
MDVLKKIKSATLIEALIATVLIVVIFIVSSLVINNLLLNSFNNNTNKIENRLSQLEYEYQNHKIQLPYNESFDNWNIIITKEAKSKNGISLITLKAEKNQSQKTIIKKRIDEQ